MVRDPNILELGITDQAVDDVKVPSFGDDATAGCIHTTWDEKCTSSLNTFGKHVLY